MKHILIILVSVLFISACSQTGGSNPMGLNTSVTDGFAGFNNKMKQLSIGMSEPSVKRILGTPDGAKGEGEYSYLSYNHKLITGWAWDRADYHVVFKDGQLTEYGMGEVRVKEVSGVQVLYIF